MANEDIKILIVDDNETNRMCGEMNFKRFIKYSNVASADDGTTAMQYLEKHNDVDIVFIDRMMIQMNGIPMLKEINKNPKLKDVVSVFQTGEVSLPEKQECIDNNSLYLLQKPYDYSEQGLLTDFISGLIRAKRRMLKLLKTAKKTDQNEYQLKNFEDAENVAVQIATKFPNPENIYEAIYELLINAIEHGNLELGYSAKTNVTSYTDYIEGIKSKLIDANNKTVNVIINLQKDAISLTIKDEGPGFKLNKVPKFDASVIRKHSGRGIYKAQKAFDKVEYIGSGNEVVCTLFI